MAYPAPSLPQVRDHIKEIIDNFDLFEPQHCISVECVYKCSHHYMKMTQHYCRAAERPASTNPPCDDLVCSTTRLTTPCQNCWEAANATNGAQASNGVSGKRLSITLLARSALAQRRRHASTARSSHEAQEATVSSPEDPDLSEEEERVSRLSFRPQSCNATLSAGQASNHRTGFVSFQNSPSPLMTQLVAIAKHVAKTASPLRQVTNACDMTDGTASSTNNPSTQFSAHPPIGATGSADASFSSMKKTAASRDLTQEGLDHSNFEARYAAWRSQLKVSLNHLRSVTGRKHRREDAGLEDEEGEWEDIL